MASVRSSADEIGWCMHCGNTLSDPPAMEMDAGMDGMILRVDVCQECSEHSATVLSSGVDHA